MSCATSCQDHPIFPIKAALWWEYSTFGQNQLQSCARKATCGWNLSGNKLKNRYKLDIASSHTALHCIRFHTPLRTTLHFPYLIFLTTFFLLQYIAFSHNTDTTVVWFTLLPQKKAVEASLKSSESTRNRMWSKSRNQRSPQPETPKRMAVVPGGSSVGYVELIHL